MTTSADATAVELMNRSPSRVREYRMDSPRMAFWAVSVIRLMYFRFLQGQFSLEKYWRPRYPASTYSSLWPAD